MCATLMEWELLEHRYRQIIGRPILSVGEWQRMEWEYARQCEAEGVRPLAMRDVDLYHPSLISAAMRIWDIDGHPDDYRLLQDSTILKKTKKNAWRKLKFWKDLPNR